MSSIEANVGSFRGNLIESRNILFRSKIEFVGVANELSELIDKRSGFCVFSNETSHQEMICKRGDMVSMHAQSPPKVLAGLSFPIGSSSRLVMRVEFDFLGYGRICARGLAFRLIRSLHRQLESDVALIARFCENSENGSVDGVAFDRNILIAQR
jgi:hypothetical protein